ncbi:hypothetical protein BHAOGJBA_5160 [Methylobacterium hispanicum]|uniref:Uncharacterized protein n=1 Tax=Methylobacterium hispanicum TaxID=270350 RepID=A0AAV4ZSZ9_9HYPH|nr:hypothetical protein [Methylobacterium hispanicum]GJD91612.1 hypothetical protein BHAOGJBA_5160 [Methylobacterium hispanicum]
MPHASIVLPGHDGSVVVEGTSWEEILEKLGTHDALAAVLSRLAESERFERFDRYDQRSDDARWAQEVAELFLRDGPEAAEAHVAGTIGQSAEDYYDNVVAGQPGTKRILAAVDKGLRAAFPDDDADEIREAVGDFLRQRMSEALEAADKSRPFDGIHPSTKVLVAFAPGQETEWPNAEDWSIDGHGKSVHPHCVEPGPLLAAYLSFANVPRDELLAAWRTRNDPVDPVNPVRGPGETDHDWERRVQRAGEWREFDWPTHSARPRLQDPEAILEVLDNAGYCSIPVMAFRVPLRAFLTRDWDAPLELSPGPYGKVGEIGLHNFVHGAGHARANREPVTLPAGRGGFRPTENWGYGYDKVYGLALSHLDVAIADGPKAEAAPEEPVAGPRP